jgi:hypothetical protein
MFLRRLILWSSPVFWFLGLELISMVPSLGWIVGGILLAYLVFVILFLKKLQVDKSFFHFLILPLTFGISSFLFSSFLVDKNAYHAIAALSAVCLFLVLRQYYFYFNYPFKYQPYSLESLSLYLCLLTGFFFFSSCFGTLILLQLNLFLLLAILFVVSGLMTYQFFWIHKVAIDKSRLFVVCIALVLVELFVAISYLPTGYYVNSFILTISYYLMLGFSKHFLANTLTKRRVAIYVSLAVVSVLAVLLTAQWS